MWYTDYSEYLSYGGPDPSFIDLTDLLLIFKVTKIMQF